MLRVFRGRDLSKTGARSQWQNDGKFQKFTEYCSFGARGVGGVYIKRRSQWEMVRLIKKANKTGNWMRIIWDKNWDI